MERADLERWWMGVISGGRDGVIDKVAAAGLLVGSLPFEAIARIRGMLYDAKVLPVLRLPVPVVSFGNLTVGGTGKTPAVIWCAEFLQSRGMRPGIASRGYRPPGGDEELPNDESALLDEALPSVPHVWDVDRAAAGKSLVLDHNCDVVILDDGFQHRRLHRTLDILLIDATNPFGFGHLLPRGLLREPVSALERATAVIVTRANLASRDKFGEILGRIREADPEAKIAQAIHRPKAIVRADDVTEPVESIQGKKVFAFSGIGNPHAFITTLTNLGAKVVGMRSFDDHHEYTEADMQTVFDDASARGAELVITTRKDRVKTGWQEGRRLALAELRVEFEITAGKESIEGMLDWMIRSVSTEAKA